LTHLFKPTVTWRTIYGLCAVSHSGKDAVLAAARAIAGERLGHFIRYATRKLREGDAYIQSSVPERDAWNAEGRIIDEIHIYNDGYLFQLREERDRILSERPVASHFTVEMAHRYRAQGICVSFSRLVTPGREHTELSERVRTRAEADAARQREIDASDAFDGPDIVNDFSRKAPSRIFDRDGRPIPEGAVRAAVQWLQHMSACEGWQPSFIEEGLAAALR
jgi:hypothetical protein